MLPSPAEITYFYEVALLSNVSQAATKLRISQPSLSLAIKRLEKSMGTSLFIRHKQGVTLTQAGKKLFQEVKPMLLHWENTKTISVAYHREVQGEVSIGCHTTVGLFLNGFIPQLLQQYPKLSFNLKHDVSPQTTANVVNSIVDIGIVVNPMKHPDLIMRKISVSETTFWSSISPSINQDLNSDQLVIVCDPNIYHTQPLLKKWKNSKLASARILTSNSLEIVANLTVHGCGIGIMSSCFTHSLYPNKLQRVPNAPVCYDDLYLIYRKENRDVKAIVVVVEAIKKLIGSH